MRTRILFVALLAGTALAEPGYLQQSHGAGSPSDIDAWRKKENRNGLKPYPKAPAGTPNPPGGLWQFGGGSESSFCGPDLGMPFAEWRAKQEKQKPAVDKAARAALEARFNLGCTVDKAATMSRGFCSISPRARNLSAVNSSVNLSARWTNQAPS